MVVAISGIRKAIKQKEEEQAKIERLSLFNPEFFPSSVPGGRKSRLSGLVGGGGFGPNFGNAVFFSNQMPSSLVRKRSKMVF